MGAKAVSYEVVEPGTEPYLLLDAVRLDWHPETMEARIVLVWRKDLRPDPDGRLVLGQCRRVGDSEKELSGWDFVVLLNKEAWEHEEFTDARRRALLDHELCHAAQALDPATGEQRLDERGRRVWRVRRHDVEEFGDVVDRHGTYKRDLERFAEALLARARRDRERAAPVLQS